MNSISPLEVTLTSDFSDSELSKKITMRVVLGSDDRMVYKDMFRFSSNNKNIKLRYWKPSDQADTDEAAAFKPAKRVFHSSFDVELSFDKKGSPEEQIQPHYLAGTEIVVSCVVVKNDGSSQAHSFCLPLIGQKEHGTGGHALLAKNGNIFSPPALLYAARDTYEVRDTESFYLKQGNSFLDQVLGLMHEAVRMSAPWILFCITLFVGAVSFLWWYRRRAGLQLLAYLGRMKKITRILAPLGLMGLLGYVVPAGMTYVCLGIYAGILGGFLVLLNVKRERLQTLAQFWGGALIIAAPVMVVWGILLFLGA